MDCLFCKIGNGEIPSYTIYEDDIVKVFLDIHPLVNAHLLIIPKEHYLDVNDIDSEVLIHIYKTIAPKMFNLLKDKLDSTGYSIGQNNGSAQDIKHYHVHIIPKYGKQFKLIDVKEIYDKLK